MDIYELKNIYNIINSKHFKRKQLLEKDHAIYMTDRCIIFRYQWKNDKTKKIIIKKISNSSRELSENSFFLGRFVLNKMKSVIPTFRFTFGYETDPRRQLFYLEYIKGVTFSKFITSNLESSDTYKLHLFHNFMFQIIVSLEMIQERFKFTHYDLHLSNIMIRPVSHKKNFNYHVFHRKLELKNMGYVVQIIDFDFSCATSVKSPVAFEKLIPYGYSGIFLSGTDLLRIFFSIKKKVESCKSVDPNTLANQIKSFIDFVFKHHFKIIFDSNDYKSSVLHEKTYFSMINQEQVFYTPLSLLVFLLEHKKRLRIKNIKYCIQQEKDARQSLYRPLLTSSVDAMEIFIRKFKDIPVDNYHDLYISRMVQSLKDLTYVYKNSPIKSIYPHPILQHVKYLQ